MIPAIDRIESRSELPVLGLGCVRLGGSGSRGVRLVHHALDIGVQVFDTADAYGNGQSETLLGRALRRRRHEAFIATKGGYRFKERSALLARAAGPLMRSATGKRVKSALPVRTAPLSPAAAYTSQDFRPSYLKVALDGSLRRLGTDYVDLYQLHGPRAVRDDVLSFAEDMQTAGKIRGFGIGIEDLGAAEGWIKTETLSHIQVPFGILDPEALERIIPLAAARSISVFARGVYAAGFISRTGAFDVASLRPGQAKLISALAELGCSAAVSPLQIAIWWVAIRPPISGLLIGTSSPVHLTEAVRYLHTQPDREIVSQAERLLMEASDLSNRLRQPQQSA